MLMKKDIFMSVFRLLRLAFLTVCCGVVFVGLIFIVTGKFYINYALPVSTLAAIIISHCLIDSKKLKRAGFAFRTEDIIFCLVGFAATAVFYVVTTAIESLIYGENLFSQYITAITTGITRSPLSVLLVPITEEMLFRGYILSACFQSMKRWQRSVIAALLFSVAHWAYVPGTGFNAFLLVNVVSTFVIGMLLNNIRFATRTIWCGVAVHWLYNYIGMRIYKGNMPSVVFTIVTVLVSVLVFVILERKIRQMEEEERLISIKRKSKDRAEMEMAV